MKPLLQIKFRGRLPIETYRQRRGAGPPPPRVETQDRESKRRARKLCECPDPEKARKKRESIREWRAKNPEKVRKIQARYRAKNRDKIRAYEQDRRRQKIDAREIRNLQVIALEMFGDSLYPLELTSEIHEALFKEKILRAFVEIISADGATRRTRQRRAP
jgi:hypothetical protein